MKRIFFLLATLILISSTSKVSYAQVKDKIVAGISLDRLKRFENFIQLQISKETIPGAVVLIARNGQSVYKSAFGLSDKESKRQMKTDDIFYIQSMTKPIITTAFMILFEEGHFLLTDPLSKYLPAAKKLRVIKNKEEGISGETVPLKKEITIADLLSHTAGFSHGIGDGKYENEIAAEIFKPYKTVQERVDKLLSLPLLGQPGEQWAYSAAPDILSVLIEMFSGQSTNQFLTERIFKPLRMQNTAYNLTKEQQGRVVKVHGPDKAGVLINVSSQPRMEGNTLWSGVNALFSTAEDYAHFCQMLLNGGKYEGIQLLSPKTIELMTLNHSRDLFDTSGEGFGYGFAVVKDISETNNLGSSGMFYWAGAFNTHFFIDPKENLIAIFMTETDKFNWYYHQKLRQMVYQAIAD